MPFQVMAIGEILWDIFPDGPRFGGAPANFACSVAELGKESVETRMVSAVGDDQLGRKAIESLQSRGVITSLVQAADRPTGRVLVDLDGQGVATYRFEEDSAWDRMCWKEELRKPAAECDAVCFGTLGQRSAMSRETIRSLLNETPESALRILDVNLREPYFDAEAILDSLELANVLKLNDDELPRIAGLANCVGDDISVLQQLAQRFDLRCIALTRGADGAVMFSEQSVSDLPGVPVPIVDTVGAGDAFTASMTMDLLAGVSLDEVNQHAISVASYVCSRPGATMPFPPGLSHSSK